MALGIEQNSIAPSLIQNSGNAMTEIIRETGRQVQGHIVELQTRRDMAAMAQEMQGLVPQSNEFPIQLIQLASRHPLAIADERGKMAVAVLGQAHNNWRKGIEAQEEFNRDRAMLGYRERAMRERAAAEAQLEAQQPKVKVIGGNAVDFRDPMNPRTVYTSPEKPATPRTLSRGSILVSPTGEKLEENPLPEPGLTPYQSAQIKRSGFNDKVKTLKDQIARFDKDIESSNNAYEATFKREREALQQRQAGEVQKYITEKTEIGKVTEALMKERAKRINELEAIMREGPQVGEEAALFDQPSPDVSSPEITTSPVQVTTTIKRDPKTGKRYEVDVTTKQIIREVP